MVIIIPKKRQCKKLCSVGSVCAMLTAALVICCITGVKMTAWNDFVGEGARGLEGGRTALFPRSLSLYDYQKTLWFGAGGAEVDGDGDRAGGAKVKRGVKGDKGGGAVKHKGEVVSSQGNFDVQDVRGKNC